MNMKKRTSRLKQSERVCSAIRKPEDARLNVLKIEQSEKEITNQVLLFHYSIPGCGIIWTDDLSVTSHNVSMRRRCYVGHRADPEIGLARVPLADSALWKILKYGVV
ncbi:hypothetical protein Sjap_012757 [Stephania japonica]|uniref:Uncharacterized protein n=1 Tax=Stephania japonica TaxID=461633 RepID=A0AAP0IXE0_9MAGN